MLRNPLTPRHVLMTVDAVGGVWRYAVDLAVSLQDWGITCDLRGFGPEPVEEQQRECRERGVALDWVSLPLDWTAEAPQDVVSLPAAIEAAARRCGADLVQVNVPSQAAGCRWEGPIVAVSHSCLATWWAAVRGGERPSDWRWRVALTGEGMRRAEVVVAPTAAHGEAIRKAYGEDFAPRTVPNAAGRAQHAVAKEPVVVSAGRWWDDGKNAAVLDAAAALVRWPVLAFGATQGPQGQGFAFRMADARGEQPRQIVSEAMARCAVFVSASLYEPFGLAALEAAAQGCALVLADIPTFRETWQGAALFFDARDPASLAGRLAGLAGDEASVAGLGEAARRRARHFTFDRQASAMIEVYRAALDARRSLHEVG
jgi:glycosyltransferase involved in cell wall biosynthesis